MHAFFVLSVLAAPLLLAAPSQLSRRQLNPFSFHIGTEAKQLAKQNVAFADQLLSQVTQLQQECAQLEGREQLIVNGDGVHPVLSRRQLGTVFAVQAKHANTKADNIMQTLGEQVSDVTQCTQGLLASEHLPTSASPFNINDGPQFHARLVRRIFFIGTILSVKSRKQARQIHQQLVEYQQHISTLQADLARVRATQDARLEHLDAPMQVENHVDIQVVHAPLYTPPNAGGVLANAEDRSSSY